VEPIYNALKVKRGSQDKIYLIGVKGENHNPSTDKYETLAIFYAHGDIVYQCDNIIKTPYADLDFVRDYKLYNLKNMYSDAIYLETDLEETEAAPEAFCISNVDDKELFIKLQNNLLNPHGRLILHLNFYYIENAEMFYKLGFKDFGEYFYQYIEKNFPPDEVSIRKSYVRYLENKQFDKVKEKLIQLEKDFSLNDFDISNLAYIEKMNGDFEKACRYYSQLEFNEDTPEYIYKDYIWCLEQAGDNEKADDIKRLLRQNPGAGI